MNLLFLPSKKSSFQLVFQAHQMDAGTHVVKMDLVNNPLDIGPFGVDGIVVKTENMSDTM
jgi:hypothetical protein